MGRIRLKIGDSTFHLPPEGGTVGRPNPTERWEPDISLHPNTTVSRRHARVWFAEGELHIQDLGSRHGTFLALPGETTHRLPTNQPTPIPSGAIASFGDAMAEILWEVDPAAPVHEQHLIAQLPTPGSGPGQACSSWRGRRTVSAVPHPWRSGWRECWPPCSPMLPPRGWQRSSVLPGATSSSWRSTRLRRPAIPA